MSAEPRDDAAEPSHVVAIGASAGGLDGVRRIAAALPEDFPAPVCVVMHVPPGGKSLLAPILDREGPLVADIARDGEELLPGRIYVARADHHLVVRDGRLALWRGPKENGTRPAVDVLFRSLAASWGPRAIAVVLSGALDDGASGAAHVAAAGGRVVVQDPVDALVPSMPEAAIAAVGDAQVCPVGEIALALVPLTRTTPLAPVTDAAAHPSRSLEVRWRPDAPASGYTCPECSGAIWEIRDGPVTRFRCRVGHSYSAEAFAEEQGASVEAALYAALESLEERHGLLERMAERSRDRPASAAHFRRGAELAARRADVVRAALAGHGAEGAA